MSAGQWIKVNGESGHDCKINLPTTVNGYMNQLQKRHAGSIWQCNCSNRYEWSGKEWVIVQ